MMSSTGERRSLVEAARRVWGLGGMRAFYRGLTVRHCVCQQRILLIFLS